MMFGKVWVLVLVGFAIHRSANGQGDDLKFPLVGYTSGSCVTYPEDGPCAQSGFGGKLVFKYDGANWTDEFLKLADQYARSDRVVQSLGGAECLDSYFVPVCASLYPLCDPDTMLPRKPCRSMCEYVTTNPCLTFVTVAKGAGFANQVFECSESSTRRIGVDYAEYPDMIFPGYPQDWANTHKFESDTYTNPTLLGETDVVQQCVTYDEAFTAKDYCKAEECPAPYIEQRYPILTSKQSIDFVNPEDIEYCADTSHDLDCSRCWSTCELPCPVPLAFTDGEYFWMHFLTWFPGMIAVPFTLLVFQTERKKIKAKTEAIRVDDCFILFASIFSLMLFVMETMPSMILSSDIRCNNNPTFSMYRNLDGSPYCAFGKLKVHVLQALMFTVVGSLFRVRNQLKATQRMIRYKMSPIARRLFMFLIFGLPSLLAIITLAAEEDQRYAADSFYRIAHGGVLHEETLYMPNNLRYLFTCGPKFKGVVLETLVVHAPLLIAGLMSFLLSFQLLQIIADLAGVSLSSTARRRGSSKNAKKPNPLLISLAKSMVLFAFISMIVLAIYVAASLLFLPRAVEFGTKNDKWKSCVVSGIDFDENADDSQNIDRFTDKSLAASEANCGKLRDIAPSASLLYLLAIAQSLPSLAFGLVFAVPALKQLISGGKISSSGTKTSRVGPTTSAISTTAEFS